MLDEIIILIFDFCFPVEWRPPVVFYDQKWSYLENYIYFENEVLHECRDLRGPRRYYNEFPEIYFRAWLDDRF